MFQETMAPEKKRETDNEQLLRNTVPKLNQQPGPTMMVNAIVDIVLKEKSKDGDIARKLLKDGYDGNIKKFKELINFEWATLKSKPTEGIEVLQSVKKIIRSMKEFNEELDKGARKMEKIEGTTQKSTPKVQEREPEDNPEEF